MKIFVITCLKRALRRLRGRLEDVIETAAAREPEDFNLTVTLKGTQFACEVRRSVLCQVPAWHHVLLYSVLAPLEKTS